MDEPDLAGVYITDDHIDAIVGRDLTPSVGKRSLSDLSLSMKVENAEHDDVKRVYFEEKSVEAAVREVCEWIDKRTNQVRSVGIGCYGPFLSLSKLDRDNGDPSYGKLLEVSHGVRLSNYSLPELFRSSLMEFTRSEPLLTVETDVSAAVVGEVYSRSWAVDGERDHSIDDQVLVFAKISHGIGAAFIRANTIWHGRISTEAGQIFVPRWRGSSWQSGVKEEAFISGNSRHMGSVESLASVSGLLGRFDAASLIELQADYRNEAWDREAWYLAHMAWTISCIVSPHHIIFGGRIMDTKGLIQKVQRTYLKIFGKSAVPDYLDVETFLQTTKRPGPNGVNRRPGVRGALCIAAMEHRS